MTNCPNHHLVSTVASLSLSLNIMATNNTVTTVSLDLVCKLCDKTYQHKDGPLLMSCLHSFCKPCLVKHGKKEECVDNKISCPTCNVRSLLPNNDISQLPINLRLSRLVKITMYEKQAEEGHIKCQKCKGAPKDATTFSCNRCKFLCDDCKSDYEHYFDDEELEFIDLATYEKGEFRIHSPPPKCPQHKKQELVIYCNDCNTLICSLCSQTKHQEHTKSSIDETVDKEKTDLQQLLLTNGIDDALTTLDQTLQQIPEMRNKIKTSAKEATKRINKACDDLIEAVEERRNHLVRKCQDISEGKDDALSNQMIKIQQLRIDLAFVQLHTNDAINNHTPEEILTIKTIIEEQMNRTMKKYKQQSMELTEDDNINTALEIEPLIEEIRKVGYFPNIPDHSKCSINGLAVPFVIVGKERKMGVVLNDERESPIQGGRPFQYELRKVSEDHDDQIPPKVTVTQCNNGIATLGFTPEQPGEYEMTVMIRNKPITNTHKITAGHSRDYKGLQNMPVSYKNVGGQCYGVAVHNDGTVYATSYTQNTIKVFKPDGTESQIGSSDNNGGQLSYPRGITLIDDTIYVVSHGNHTIKMYSTNGRFIGSFGGYGTGNGQLSSPLVVPMVMEGSWLLINQINVFKFSHHKATSLTPFHALSNLTMLQLIQLVIFM